jgi:gas vesicle protein
MINKKDRYSGLAVFCAFLGGAVAGAVAGILLTPKSGQEVRSDLEDYAREKKRYLIRKAKKARASLDDAIEKGKTLLSEYAPITKNHPADKPDAGMEEGPTGDTGQRPP